MPKQGRILKFGLIGCGGIATDVHAVNMSAIDGAKLVGYCDIDESKAANLLEKFGGDYVTTDALKIIDDKNIDGVLIQTGPKMHAEFVQAAAKAKKHVFVEKPLAIELADAVLTVRAVEEAGIKFQFGVCNRLAPMVKIAKRRCTTPLYSYCQCSHQASGQSPHNLDLAVNLFHEAQLVKVYASGGQFWKLDPGLPADSYSAVLTFADGSTHTYIQHGRSFNPMLTKYSYQLFGKDTCVYLAKRFKECHIMKSFDVVEQSWIFQGSDQDRGPNGYMGHFDELLEFVDCIRNGGQCTMTVRDAAYVLAVDKAILSSIETGNPVSFPEFLGKNSAGFLLEGRKGS